MNDEKKIDSLLFPAAVNRTTTFFAAMSTNAKLDVQIEIRIGIDLQQSLQ